MHHSSISHRSSLNHRSSLSHRSSLRNKPGLSARKTTFKRHGISNAHAFSVGRATGININGSAMGAHGAALHRMKASRDRTRRHREVAARITHMRRPTTRITRRYKPTSRFSKAYTFRRPRRTSYSNKKYTAKQGQKIEKINPDNVTGIYKTDQMMILFVIIFIAIFLIMLGTFATTMMRITTMLK